MNKLCEKCRHSCKQLATTKIIKCPMFEELNKTIREHGEAIINKQVMNREHDK